MEARSVQRGYTARRDEACAGELKGGRGQKSEEIKTAHVPLAAAHYDERMLDPECPSSVDRMTLMGAYSSYAGPA